MFKHLPIYLSISGPYEHLHQSIGGVDQRLDKIINLRELTPTTSSQYLDLKYPKFLSAESGPRMGPR